MGKTKMRPQMLASIMATMLILYGCSKTELDSTKPPPPPHPSFAPASIKDVQIRAFATEILRQDSENHFLEQLSTRSGIPKWDKAIKIGDSSKMTIYIPLILKGQQKVNAFIVGRRSNAAFSFRLYHSNFLYANRATRLSNYEIGMFSRYFNREIFGISSKEKISAAVVKSMVIKLKNSAALDNAKAPGNAFLAAAGPKILTNSMNCVSFEEEYEIWRDPDGDADPCDCSGNEYIVGYDYSYTTVCDWQTGGGGGEGEEGGEPGDGWPGGGGTGNGGGGNDMNEWEYDFSCDCYHKITQWWIDDQYILANFPAWVMPDPDKQIANVIPYLSVFDNTANSIYTVTIAADQPNPTNRMPVKVVPSTQVIDVGHAFLILKQLKPDGTFITRSLGFYPHGVVKPGAPTDQGNYQDDASHNYDISLELKVPFAQIDAVRNFLISHRNDIYDLNSNNCTDVALKAMDEIGVHLPKTINWWPGGAGCNPGDLGEDIREFVITNPSTQYRNMNGGKAPANNP